MNQVIISLTSYGERINSVHHVVESLKNQLCSAYKVILLVEKKKLSRI